MNKYLEIIRKLNKEIQIKWWILEHYKSMIQRLSLLKQTVPLTVNRTLPLKILNLIIYGKTVQDGEPTPENPVEIINLEGKNLASLETSSEKIIRNLPFAIEEGIIKINGTTDSSTPNSFYFDSFQTKNGIATIWAEITGYTDNSSGNSVIGIQESTNNSNWSNLQNINFASTLPKQYSITLDSNKYYRIWLFAGANNVFTNAEIKIQLEYGTTKTEFVPYNSIGVKVQNKNLCFPELTNLFVNSNGEVVTLNGIYTMVLPIENNTELSISGDYSLLDSNYMRVGLFNSYPLLGVTGTRLSITNSNKTFSVTGYSYVMLCFYLANSGITVQDLKNKIQVEWGQPTEIIPHQEQTKYFTLEEGQYLAEGDYLSDDGIHKVIGQIVFDGSDDEDWVLAGLSFFIPYSGSSVNVLCSHFTRSDSWSSSNVNYRGKFQVSLSDERLKFMPLDENTTTLNLWKTWLATKYSSGNPVKVQYPLLQEVVIPYTQNQQAQWNAIKTMKAYAEQTNIDILANLSGIEIDITLYAYLEKNTEMNIELSNGRGEENE